MSTFFQNAGQVAGQVLILFILMAFGFVCAKVKLINETGSKQLTKLLFTVVTVCVVVKSFVTIEFTKDRLYEMGIMSLCCILSVAVGAIILFPMFRNTDKYKRSVLRFAAVFSNCGFMGLPMADAVLGSEGVFLVSIFMVTFQVLIWTFGIAIFNTGKKIEIKNILLNPGIIGVVIGLPLFLIGVKLPNVILSPIEHLAALNTPVAMLIMGYCMSKTRLVPEKEDLKILLVSFIRLLAVPAAVYAILHFGLKINGVLLIACMIPTAAPTAANTAVFANMFDRDVVLSSRAVAIGTLLSIITMPLVIAVAGIS